MSKTTILVVDDQTNVRNILDFNLKRRGFSVVAAEDGLAALEKASAAKPQLILLDIMMPNLDGFQVLERLKGSEQTRSIPVLIVSAKGTESDIVRALKLGALDYVVKPFNLELLIQKIYRLLDRSPEAAAGAAAAVPSAATPAPDAQPKSTLPVHAVVKIGATWPSDDAVEATLRALATAAARSIVIDLTGTGPVATISFGKLSKIQQELKKSGMEISLVIDSTENRQTLSESGFHRHLPVHPTVGAALGEAS